MNLHAPILRFARDITRKRVTSGGGYDPNTGLAVPATSDTTTIRATVQPVTGRARENMPEGVRDNASQTMWTLETIERNDRYIIDEQEYLVLERVERPLGGFSSAVLGDADNAS